ncbi:MAG: PKD domain-containing protein, partial [Bacteroidales bacterium]|nr:PKD domain-containing protein [Bacteroidales bacterium]
NPSHTYALNGTYTVSLTVTNSNGCMDDTTLTIEVYPSPVANFSDSSLCTFEVFFTDLSIHNADSIQSWYWIFGDGDTDTVRNPVHIYPGNSIYSVTLIVTNSNGCVDSITKPVIVEPAPLADFTADTVCVNTATQFTDLSTSPASPIVSWTWVFDDGDSAFVKNPTHTYTVAGIYNVTLIIVADNGCSDTITQPVLVWPEPVAQFSTTAECVGYPTIFNDESVANADSLVAWSWNFGDGSTSTQQSPTHTYVLNGTYTVSLTVTNSNGCIDDTSMTVEVFPLPVANFTDSTDCNGYWAYFYDLSVPNAPGIVSWHWDFGDGSTSTLQNPSHQYPAAGTYSVTLTVVNSNNCTNSITIPVVIIPAPVAAFTSDTACAMSATTFIDLSTTTNGIIIQWWWDFGDGGTSTIQNPTHTYTAPGTYPVTLAVETNQGCRDTAYGFAEVWPLPVSAFTYAPTCEYDAVVFSDLSIANSASIASWNWDFGDGTTSTAQNPTHLYPGFGIYNVTLQIVNSNGCVDDTTMPIEVWDQPVANFIDSVTCDDYIVYFTDLSDSVNTPIVSWYWNFGDGYVNVNQNPMHQYAAAGTYTVTLIVTNSNGCSDTISRDVTVWDPPIAEFSSDTVCVFTPTTFTDLSYAANGGIVKWYWDFGDGTTSSLPEPQHTFTTPGTHLVSLTVWAADSCSATVTHPVEVWPLPEPIFAADSVCLGENTQFTDFSIANATSIVSWNWNFGDGGFSSAQNPVHMFTAVGTYPVTLTVMNSNGCVNDTTIDIIVYPLPIANFLDSTAQSSLTVYFTDISIPMADSIVSWNWDFGDPPSGANNTSTLQHPQHLYPIAGDYTICLTIVNSNGCGDEICRTIRVEADPVAIFTADTACFESPTHFYDLSIPNGDSLISWLWTFGDGNTSTLQNPTHTYGAPGTYWVTLEVVNSHFGEDDTSMWVLVHPLPDVAFEDSLVCGTLEVYFTDLSVANADSITSWFWDFGDGTTSTLQNPFHVYDSMANYTISLIVTNSNGCQDTSIRTIWVNPGPIAAFDPHEACSQVPVQFTDQSIANQGSLTNWWWDFGDGGTATGPNPTHTFATPGVYIVTLIVMDNFGCADTLIQPVTINPDPVAMFDFDDLICDGEVAHFFDESLPWADSLVAWWWDFGDGGSSTAQNPTHLFPTNGFYTVTLTVENSNGCQDDTAMVVEVFSSPTAAFITSQPLCLADTVDFLDMSTPGQDSIISWYWDFGDGYTSTLQNPSHLYNWSGSFLVSLLVTNSNGCISLATDSITIVESPIADFDHDYPCWGTMTQFTDLSVNPGPGVITSWSWDFGDGGTEMTQNPSHVYSAAGTYTVTLTVVNNSGCEDEISKMVQIYNGPEAAFTFDNVCEGYDTYFHSTSIPGDAPIVNYYWDFGDGTTATGIQSPTHQYASIGFYNVTLIIGDAHGCFDSISHNITIYPGPTADFIADTVCVGSPTNFHDVSTPQVGIVSWSWNFGDPSSGGQNVSSLQHPQHTYSVEGFYNVTLTVVDTNDCFHTIVKTIYAEPEPIADFTYTGSCEGTPVQFFDLSQTYSGNIEMWVWDYGDGSGDTIVTPSSPNVSHLYPASGQYTVTLTVINTSGCEGTVSKVIIIAESPEANFTYDMGCEGDPVQFFDATPGGDIIAWQWNFGDPASGANNTSTLPDPVHVFTGMGTYNVSLVVVSSLGCYDTIIKSVNIQPTSPVDFYWDAACEDEITQFYSDTTVVNVNMITNYNWDFGDGYWSNLMHPGHVYDGDGVYNVTLTITDTNNCESQLSQEVVVKKRPNAFYDVTEPTCLTDSVFFNNMSTSQDGYIVTWVWDFDDGSPLDSITFPNDPNVWHKFDSVGTYGVTLYITSSIGCSHEYSREVHILPEPAADFMYSDTCSEQAVQFTDLSDTIGHGEFVYEWNFGDPASGIYNTSNQTNPTHTYVHGDSTYNVTLIITNYAGCDDTIVKSIYIKQSPAVAFQWNTACEDTLTHFYPDSSIMDVSTISIWFWDFGDGTFAYEPDPMHQFPSVGTYYVTLTVQDTGVCSNSITVPVIVSESPVAMFNLPQTSCQYSTVYFDDQSYGQGSYITEWHWDFGDGTDTTIFFPGDPDVYHTYNFGGTFAVTLTVTSAQECLGQITHLLTISDVPEAQFEYENTCYGGATQFYDMTSTSGSAINSWYWNFGDPNSGILNTSSQQNPEHAFTAMGTYNVILVVSNASGCVDTVMQAVAITEGQAVDFIYENNCMNQSTYFYTDTAVTNIGAIQIFEWDFGDGSPGSNLVNPEHTYATAGVYTVTLTITDYSDCISTVSHNVEVMENPVALFSYETGCEGTPVQFTDFSYTNAGELITSWYWNFGDPASGAANFSTERHPTHVFTNSGTFQVELMVTSQSGCMDSITLPVSVDSGPEAEFSFTTSSCLNGTVSFFDESIAYMGQIVSWRWIFEPGYQSGLQNPNYTFSQTDTTYIVMLAVEDSKGCRDTIYKDVTVPADLDAVINSSMDCFGQDMMFSANILQPLPNSIYSYDWNFGDPGSGIANTSHAAEPAHEFTNPGTYIVKLDFIDQFGCDGSITREIVVHPLPAPDFSWDVDVCDSVFRFTDLSATPGFGVQSLTWNFGDGSPATTQSGPGMGYIEHTYNDFGTYSVTLIVEGTNGCIDSISRDVTRETCIIPGIAYDSVVCQNTPVIFNTTSTVAPAITNWYWNFGDGTDTIYYETSGYVDHVYRQTGEFTIRFAVTAMINGSLVSDTIYRSIEVMPAPDANFFTGPGCMGSPVSFYDSTISIDSYVTAWQWNFGTSSASDTSTAQSPHYQYENTGNYVVTMVAMNNYGCFDTVKKPIAINYAPMAAFEYTPGCLNQPVEFNDLSETEEGDRVIAWSWNFGDGSTNADTSHVQNPSYSYGYMGPKAVELIVYNTSGCPDTIRQLIDIHPNPTADFIILDNYEDVQGQVALEDLSLDAESYYWDLGDGFTVYDDYPPIIHRYEEDGTYMVEQVVWNKFGCPDTARREYDFLFKTLYIPNALNPNGFDPETKVFQPKGRNLQYYHIAIYNSWGEKLWESNALDSEGRPAESWDGTYEGKLVPSDVYLWKAEAIFKDGTVWEGSVVGHTDGMDNRTSGYVVVVR